MIARPTSAGSDCILCAVVPGRWHVVSPQPHEATFDHSLFGVYCLCDSSISNLFHPSSDLVNLERPEEMAAAAAPPAKTDSSHAAPAPPNGSDNQTAAPPTATGSASAPAHPPRKESQKRKRSKGGASGRDIHLANSEASAAASAKAAAAVPLVMDGEGAADGNGPSFVDSSALGETNYFFADGLFCLLAFRSHRLLFDHVVHCVFRSETREAVHSLVRIARQRAMVGPRTVAIVHRRVCGV